MKKKSRKEEENESSAKQVKGHRKRQESACRKGNREEEIRKEIHKMNPALWGLVCNFGGDGSKKSWRRETYNRTERALGPQSSASACCFLCSHYLGCLEAPNPTCRQVPRVYFHSPISWYKDPCLASTWGGFRGAGVSIFMISSQHCFHWPEGRAMTRVGGGRLRGPGRPLPRYIPFHTFWT